MEKDLRNNLMVLSTQVKSIEEEYMDREFIWSKWTKFYTFRPNGDRYEVQFKYGKKHGEGKKIFDDKTERRGIWEQDKIVKWLKWSLNGDYYAYFIKSKLSN